MWKNLLGHCSAEDQSYVLHNLRPFFEETDAVGCGSPCVGIACKHALHEETACGQRPEMEARATFSAMFAPSLKRCMRSGVGAHVRALQRGNCLQACTCDAQCNTHRKEGLWTKAGSESQSYVLCNVCPFCEEMHALGGGGVMFGHCAENRTGRQSYVLHNLCSYFEEMDAGGCGSPCVGIACKQALHEETQ